MATALLEEHVRHLAASGAAVLIVEQRARAVLAISDRTYVLGGGEVRMEGTPAELSASPEFVESFLGGRGPAAKPGRLRPTATPDRNRAIFAGEAGRAAGVPPPSRRMRGGSGGRPRVSRARGVVPRANAAGAA